MSKSRLNLLAVADEIPRADALVVWAHGQVACLLAHPAAVRVCCDRGDVDAAGRELDDEEDVEALAEQGVDGEEVALEDARRLRAQELRPARVLLSRCWLDRGVFEDRPDGARCRLDPMPDQLALDPPLSPCRVLAREPHDELTNLRRCRRPAWTPMRIGRATRDQLPMPAQHGRGRHEQRSLPSRSRQHAAERRQQRPVSLGELRTNHLTLQHPQQMR